VVRFWLISEKYDRSCYSVNINRNPGAAAASADVVLAATLRQAVRTRW
jgi:hypothetical protein